MKVGFTQVLLARANSEWEWPTGGTEQRPVFQPSLFHETKGSEGLSLQQGEQYVRKNKDNFKHLKFQYMVQQAKSVLDEIWCFKSF